MEMAYKESLYKSQRVLATFDIRLEKARQGIKWTTKCPFWMSYDPEKKDFFENEYTHTARRIIDLCVNESWGAHRIANYLNDNGGKYPRPPNSKSKKWTKTSVYYVLNSRAIFGEWQPTRRTVIEEQVKKKSEEYPAGKLVTVKKRFDAPHGDPIENYYMPIATENEFYRIKLQFEKNTKVGKDGKKRGVGGEKGRFANLYRGLTKCWDCGTALVVKRGYSFDYLTCNAQGLQCNSLSSPYHQFEEVTIDLLRQSDALVAPKSKANKRLEIISLEAEITKQDHIIQKNNIMIESLGTEATPEVLGNFAKAINNASITKNKITEKIVKLEEEQDEKKIDKNELLKLDLKNADEREQYNKLISRDVNLISRSNGFILVRKKGQNAFSISALNYFYRRMIALDEKTAEVLFNHYKKNHPKNTLIDNYSFKPLTKKKITTLLNCLKQEKIANDLYEEYCDLQYNQKRLLRLLREKHKIDYPPALLKFEGIFIRGAIYKRMNFDYIPIRKAHLEDFESYKDYRKWVGPAEEIKAMAELKKQAKELYDKKAI